MLLREEKPTAHAIVLDGTMETVAQLLLLLVVHISAFRDQEWLEFLGPWHLNVGI